MANATSVTIAKAFWDQRKTFYLQKDDTIHEKVAKYKENLQQRNKLEAQKKTNFHQHNTFSGPFVDAIGSNRISKITSDLNFWILYNSWTYCITCNSLTSKIMPFNFAKLSKNTHSKSCNCNKFRYKVPTYDEIPDCLKHLTSQDVIVLQPFYFHFHEYERHPHGYRMKCCPCKLRASDATVQNKINQLVDEIARERCQQAYNYLISSEHSSYRHYVHLRETIIENNASLNIFNFTQTQGIECALWPNLYPFTEWCESTINDSKSHLSAKISFTTKLLSEIIDYGIDFELLQFQYDRWLYKTVSGAVNSARIRHCSPARALDTKPFSATYWQWQHRFVLDAVDQFGLPDVFITISPFEWSFPFPKWLNDIRLQCGKEPTQIAGLETFHIVHILSQVVRGYLCGSNSKRWSNHVFSYNQLKTRSNIKTYFYRFEFQGRGTVHMHLLVWLNDITKTQHRLIRADIPNDNPDLAYLVTTYQKSDKPSSSLTLQEQETYFDITNNKASLHLKHPPDAFALNRRAYISTILPTLQCSMDFQTTDNRAMLLRYVTSYVTKWQDGISADALYSHNISGGQAAVRYVMETKSPEPEMSLLLSSTRISWSNSRTKRYNVPTQDKATDDKTAEKYRNRPYNMTSLSLLSWLQNVSHSKSTPSKYTSGTTLVGLKVLSIFNSQFFFQFLLLNKAHTSLSELQHPNHTDLPIHLQWYAAALLHFPEFWNNDEAIVKYLHERGHRDTYITTYLAYIHTLADTYFLWQKQVLPPLFIEQCCTHMEYNFTLDMHQQTVHNHVMSALAKRNEHYSTFTTTCNNDEIDDAQTDSDDDENAFDDNINKPVVMLTSQTMDVDWKKPIVVTGEAGCGKSYTILSVVSHLVRQEGNVLIAAPTGLLAAVFKASFPDEVQCETVHSSFHYPVAPDQSPTINWQLSNFDVIIIDEISMIPDVIFEHILKTFSVLLFRPVIFLSGDAGQQQPFSRSCGKIMQLKSAFDNSAFLNSSYNYRLTVQHRVGDDGYFQFLNTIRKWIPTQEYLDKIQEGRVITMESIITDDIIMQAFTLYAENTILTFTKNASNHCNKVIVNHLFHNINPIGCLQLDCDLPPMNIFTGMRVVVTQNRDKLNGIVNGKIATVHTMHNNSVYLKFRNEKVVAIYPVTMKENGRKITICPFSPAYATTICKAQGQTLQKVVVWFDIDNIPPGSAYVALLRVRSHDDIHFMKKLTPKYFRPVTRLAQLL